MSRQDPRVTAGYCFRVTERPGRATLLSPPLRAPAMEEGQDERSRTICATSREEMKVRGREKRKRKRSRSRSSSISSTSSSSNSPKSKSKKRKKEKHNKKRRKKENKLKKKKEKKKKREKSGPVQLSKVHVPESV
ncbi:RNA-binding protein with serine-rich domain 1-like [Alligator mississippiensis]|uniref:RNA-binding protein with serine-rich domain 1-like n=1 Tax=Alligator mississippiensis TaxID=8496 RepID=A0A151P3M1_ALLMI|nr:RNA-binding protein with serine-rich domain 1-like [Alligator mississippiensis]